MESGNRAIAGHLLQSVSNFTIWCSAFVLRANTRCNIRESADPTNLFSVTNFLDGAFINLRVLSDASWVISTAIPNVSYLTIGVVFTGVINARIVVF